MNRLCKADGLIRGSIRPCLAYASARYRGYCWAHWNIMLQLWGEHFWFAPARRQ